MSEVDKGIKMAEPGKLDWTLMPFEELEEVVKVLMFGAEKHAPEGWKQTKREEYVKAFMRHATEYLEGGRIDESGLPTLAHAICNMLFVMWHDRNDCLQEKIKSFDSFCLGV